MSDEHAKPGDIIEIIWDDYCVQISVGHHPARIIRSHSLYVPDYSGKRFAVISCPEKEYQQKLALDQPGDAWVLDEHGQTMVVSVTHYKIIKRATECQPATGNSADDSLRKRLDDNLRGVFT